MKTKHDNLLSLLFYYPVIVHLQLNESTENCTCLNFVTKDEYEYFAPCI